MLARKCSAVIRSSRALPLPLPLPLPLHNNSGAVTLVARSITSNAHIDNANVTTRCIKATNVVVSATSINSARSGNGNSSGNGNGNSNGNTTGNSSTSYSGLEAPISGSPPVREFSSLSSVTSSVTSSVSTSSQLQRLSTIAMPSPPPSPSPSPLNEEYNKEENEDKDELSLEEVYQLASQPCTPLSLSDMYKYACINAESKNYGPQRLRNAQFLHKELTIRIAQRAVDLLNLPHGLNKTKQVTEAAKLYIKYLQQLRNFPCPTNEDQELLFTDELRSIVQDSTTVPKAIAKGLLSLKDHRKEDLDHRRSQEMETALYRFFNARTGLRLLTEHHILSCTKREKENQELRAKQSSINSIPLNPEVNSFLGCIRDDSDPFLEAKAIAKQVEEYCEACYGVAPTIEVLDCTPEHFSDSKFTYVPHHLQYTLAELLKNSCRATVQRYLEGKVTTEDHVGSHNNEEGVATDTSLPSVRVVIAKGAEDVTIKVADKGGGVPRSVIGKMWTFAHSGTKHQELQSKENDTVIGRSTYDIRGFGLPLARIYARYFGGELTLKSMEGYGVDAYLYLPVLGDACENLPERVQKSPANHDSVHDGNHHAYYGDSFTSSYLSGEEPWGGGVRHFSNMPSSFDKIGRVAL